MVSGGCTPLSNTNKLSIYVSPLRRHMTKILLCRFWIGGRFCDVALGLLLCDRRFSLMSLLDCFPSVLIFVLCWYAIL